MYRIWFEVVRFYLGVALRGDPVEPAPKAKPVQRAKPAPIGQFNPLTNAK